MRKMHLIMPMGGKGSRFSKDGYEFPKPLLVIRERPFFYWATQSITKFVDVQDIIFVVLEEHIVKYAIDREIRKYFPEAKLRVIPEVLQGAVLTCIEGIKEIEDDCPVVFNDCDHIFRSREFENFCADGSNNVVDGAILTFRSNSDKYSFLRLDDSQNVVETVEKKVISNQAICGCYYFANKKLFMDSAKNYFEKCAYQEYFISGIYNVMAERGAKIRAYATDFHVPFGTPDEFEEAKRSDYFYELM